VASATVLKECFLQKELGVLASAELNRHGYGPSLQPKAAPIIHKNIGNFAKLPPKIRVEIWQHLSIPVKPKDDEGSNEELPGSKFDKDIEKGMIEREMSRRWETQ
jgi:hypothetical protein